MAQVILDPVKVATNTNLDLSLGVLQNITKIDGIPVLIGDRILVKSQTLKTQNGIYVVSANTITAGETTYQALERSSDFLESSEHLSPIVFVRAGNLFSGVGFILENTKIDPNNQVIVVGTDLIEFKRFTIKALDKLSEVTSYLTLRSEKNYPLTNNELDNNFRYLGNSLDNKVNTEDYSASAVIGLINSKSYSEAGLDSAKVRGMSPILQFSPGSSSNVNLPTNQDYYLYQDQELEKYSIPVRDEDGTIYSTTFQGNLNGTAFFLRKGSGDTIVGHSGEYYTNADNIDQGTLLISRGGTGAGNKDTARSNLEAVHVKGDTMQGKLTLFTSTANSSSLRIPPGVGVNESSSLNGDIWTSGEFIYYRLNNLEQKIARINSPEFTGNPSINSIDRTLDSSGNVTSSLNLIPTLKFFQQFRDDYIQPNLDLKATIDSPTFTTTAALDYTRGDGGEYPSPSDASTKIATTEWVQDSIDYFLAQEIVPVYETIANVALKAPINSPAFTGNPTITGAKPEVATNSTRIATTEWVQSVKDDFKENYIIPNYYNKTYVDNEARWMGSTKFVSQNFPTTNDGEIGDIWIQTNDATEESGGFTGPLYLRRNQDDTMLGNLSLVNDPSNGRHAVTLDYLQTSLTQFGSDVLFKSGGTLTGDLTLPNRDYSSISSLHAVPRQYVDALISAIDVSGVAVMKNTQDTQVMAGKIRTPVTLENDENTVLTTKDYVDEKFNQASAINGGTPIGTVVYYAANSIPIGWVECDGRSLSKNTYSSLFNVIGYTYGGSGNTFKVPDLRGQFLRGWDNGRGLDSERSFASSQSATAVRILIDQYAEGYGYKTNGVAINTARYNPGTFAVTGSNIDGFITPDTGDASLMRYSPSGGTTNVSSNTTYYVAANTIISGGNGDNLSFKVRPTNVAMIACIKALGGVIPQDLQDLSGIVLDLNGKLDTAGDTMTGFLTLHSNPTNNLHAATKQYVDSAVSAVSSTYVDTAGDTMTGFLTLHSNPTSNLHAATKQYVDSAVSAVSSTYVDTAGDTMTGFLTLHSNPTNNLHAATKQYVDSAVSGLATTSALNTAINGLGSTYVDTAGDTMTGFLTLHSNPTSNLHAATKQYVDSSVSGLATTSALNTAINGLGSTYVNRSGDTMTGFLTLHSNPTNNLHAATKQYVDSAVSATTSALNTAINGLGSTYVNRSGDIMSGYLILHANPIAPLHPATKGYVDSYFVSNDALSSTLGTLNVMYVNATGDTMSGYLTLHSNPTNNLHAATKQYVDSKLSTISVNYPIPAGSFEVGTYIFAVTTTYKSYGYNVSGSELQISGIIGVYSWNSGPNTEYKEGRYTALTRQNSLVIPGTWKCMGYAGNPNENVDWNAAAATIWVRIV